MYSYDLEQHHKRMLIEESGIAPEVVEARGYRTVWKKADLKRLGFSESQWNVPGLLVPVYSPSGEIATYQHRPDEPRVGKDGKPVKYETPGGTKMAFDVHPSARAE